MKKKFINGILMAALLFAATSSFVSCKDNIDDELPPIYNALAQKSSDLQAKIDSLKKVIDDLRLSKSTTITIMIRLSITTSRTLIRLS